MSEYLNTKEAAKFLGIKLGNLYHKIYTKEIAYSRPSGMPKGTYVLKKSDLEAYMSKNRVEACSEISADFGSVIAGGIGLPIPPPGIKEPVNAELPFEPDGAEKRYSRPTLVPDMEDSGEGGIPKGGETETMQIVDCPYCGKKITHPHIQTWTLDPLEVGKK